MLQILKNWWHNLRDTLRGWVREVRAEVNDWRTVRPARRARESQAQALALWPQSVHDPFVWPRFEQPDVRVYTDRGDLILQAEERRAHDGTYRGRPYRVATYQYAARRAPAPIGVDLDCVHDDFYATLTGGRQLGHVHRPRRERSRRIPVRSNR